MHPCCVAKYSLPSLHELPGVQVLNQKQHEQAASNEYNFDHPDAFDFELLADTLQRLKEGKKVEVPIYNFLTHSRESRTVSDCFQICSFRYNQEIS